MKDVAISRTPKLAAGASLLVLTAATTLALGACSDTADGVVEQPTEKGDGGGNVIPMTDASPEGDAGESPDASANRDAATDGAADAGARICSDDNFCHTDVPKGQNLVGVWGDGTGVVWAVSRSGSVLRWDGTAWNVHAQLTTATGTNYTIWGSGPTDVWVLTPAGLFHGEGSSSATLVFSPVALPGDATIPLTSVWGTGPNDIWIVGGQMKDSVWPWVTRGRVLHYDGDPSDGGSGWTLDSDLSSRGIAYRFVMCGGASGCWMTGQQFDQALPSLLGGVVLRRSPGSDAWTAVDLPKDPAGGYAPQARELTAFGISSDSSIWIRGATGDFKWSYYRGKSTDSGNSYTWSFNPINTWDRAIVALWGPGPNDTWGVGDSGLVTHWNGTKWQQAAIRVTDIPVSKSFTAIWGKGNDDFWVVGNEIALHRTSASKP